MATVAKKRFAPTPVPAAVEALDEKQLRRDRWIGAFAIAIVFTMIALTIWLATMGEPVEFNEMDYWHLVP